METPEIIEMTVCRDVIEFGHTLENPPKFGKTPVIIGPKGQYYFADFEAKKVLPIDGLPIPPNANPNEYSLKIK